jgi:TolB protein
LSNHCVRPFDLESGREIAGSSREFDAAGVWNVKDREKSASPTDFDLGKQQALRPHSANAVVSCQRIWIALSIGVVVIVASGVLAESKELGIFANQGSVGQTPPGCTAHYDSTTGEYRITGGGANVWGTADAFYFVWKKASGDMTLTADVQWVGSSSAEHRKALLMIRQSLDPASAYADAVSHGNGLTSLQFRGATSEQTYQVITQVEGTVRLRIERKGSRFTMYAGKPNEELKPVGPVEYVGLQDPVYVGLGVCSHVATTLETAIFSHVKLEETPPTK